LRPDRPRSDRSFGFLRYGLSDDGGLDDVAVLAQTPLQFLHLRGQDGDLRIPRRQLRGGQLVPRRRRLPQPGVHRLQLRYPTAQPGHTIIMRHIRRIGHKPHPTTAGDPLSRPHAEPAHAKSATQPRQPPGNATGRQGHSGVTRRSA